MENGAREPACLAIASALAAVCARGCSALLDGVPTLLVSRKPSAGFACYVVCLQRALGRMRASRILQYSGHPYGGGKSRAIPAQVCKPLIYMPSRLVLPIHHCGPCFASSSRISRLSLAFSAACARASCPGTRPLARIAACACFAPLIRRAIFAEALVNK